MILNCDICGKNIGLLPDNTIRHYLLVSGVGINTAGTKRVCEECTHETFKKIMEE